MFPKFRERRAVAKKLGDNRSGTEMAMKSWGNNWQRTVNLELIRGKKGVRVFGHGFQRIAKWED